MAYDDKGAILVIDSKTSGYHQSRKHNFQYQAFMGRRFDEIKDEATHVPYTLTSVKQPAAIMVRGKPVTPLDFGQDSGKLKKAAGLSWWTSYSSGNHSARVL